MTVDHLAMMEEIGSLQGQVHGYTGFNEALPLEVKCHILRLSLPTAYEDMWREYGRQFEIKVPGYYRVLSKLRLVCKTWALIIMETPMFWSFISHQLPVALRERVLTLSGSCPIDISCNFPYSEDRQHVLNLLDRIKDCPQKWKTLRLQSYRPEEDLMKILLMSQGAASNIEELWIELGSSTSGLSASFPFGGTAEQLRTLSLVRCPVSWVASGFPKLETLNLEDLPVHVTPSLSKLLDILESGRIRSLNLRKLVIKDDVGPQSHRRLSGLRLRWFGLYDLPEDATNTLLALLKSEGWCPNFGISWTAADDMSSTNLETSLIAFQHWLLAAIVNLPEQENGWTFRLELGQDATEDGYVDVTIQYGTRLDPYCFSLSVAHKNLVAPIKLLRWVTDVVKKSGRQVEYEVKSSVGLDWTNPEVAGIFDHLAVVKLKLYEWMDPDDWAIPIQGISVVRGYANFLQYLGRRIEGVAAPSWTLPSILHLDISLGKLLIPQLRTVLRRRKKSTSLVSLNLSGSVGKKDMEALEELDGLFPGDGNGYDRGLMVYDILQDRQLYPREPRTDTPSTAIWHSDSDDESGDAE